MGNDVNVELSLGSAQSALFWSHIMSRVCENIPTASFRERPSNVISAGGEYYTEGTYSRVSMTPSTTAPESTKAAPTTTEPPTTTQEQQTTTEKNPTVTPSKPTAKPTDDENDGD